MSASLKKILQKFKTFLIKLRNSDEPTKRRWVIFLASAAALLVIFVWVKYFRATLPQLTPLSEEPPLPQEESFFWETMKNGFKAIFNDAKEIINQFKELNQRVQTPNETIIK